MPAALALLIVAAGRVRGVGHARMETTAIYLQALGAEGREITARMWT
jgi:hypothetical protein